MNKPNILIYATPQRKEEHRKEHLGTPQGKDVLRNEEEVRCSKGTSTECSNSIIKSWQIKKKMSTKKGTNKICVVCSKEFYVPMYRKDTAKYCSTYCLNKGQYKCHIKKCEYCSKEFKVSNSRIRKKFCSEDCRFDSIKKYQSTKEVRKAQTILTNKKRGYNWSTKLRKYVFLLKEKKCEICGYNEYDFCLDIHHYDKNPNNNDINNLKVLCVICHKKLHKGVINFNKQAGDSDSSQYG